MNSKNSSRKSSTYLWSHGLVTLLFLLGQLYATAGELITSQVSVKEGHYLIQMVMDVDAEYKKVYQHLTNYDDLHRLSTSITESELLFAAHPEYQVRVTTFSCISFICEEVVQVQNTTELSRGYIKVSVVADKSDLNYGETLWHIQASKKGTRITYSSDMVLGFWVPPLVGPILVKNKLLEETRALINGLETVANESP